MVINVERSGFAKCEMAIPFGRQPFCRLALSPIGRGVRTSSPSRRASLQNDSPLGVPTVFNRLLVLVPKGANENAAALDAGDQRRGLAPGYKWSGRTAKSEDWCHSGRWRASSNH